MLTSSFKPLGNNFNIPLWFKEVEYLQSTGTQWVDLGITVDDEFSFQCNFQFDTLGFFPRLFGAVKSSTSPRYITSIGVANDVFRFGWGTFNATSVLAGNQYSIPFDTEIHNIFFSKDVLTIDDTSYPLANEAFLPDYNDMNIYMFNWNSAYGNSLPMIGKIFTNVIVKNSKMNQLWKTGIDTRTNKPCLYDVINDKVIYNIGTGEFITAV